MEDTLREILRDAPVRPGSELPNGAVTLMQDKTAEFEHGHEFVVLAVRPGFQPFVTWRRHIGVEQKSDGNFGMVDYCWSGSYYEDLLNAVTKFDERVETEKERAAARFGM